MDNGNGIPGGPGISKHEDMGLMDSMDDERSPSKGDIKPHVKALNRVSRASDPTALTRFGAPADLSLILPAIQAHA